MSGTWDMGNVVRWIRDWYSVSSDKRYVIMSTVCYVVATILFMAGGGRFISKVLMTEISYYYTSNWNDWVGSDLFSYCSIAVVLACIWLV